MNILNTRLLYIFILLISINSFSQKKERLEKLDTVLITSSRIDLPFKKNSRTIKVISSQEIKKSVATNLPELLQQVAGIDIRRRGTSGMQSDLYIRGGGFDQTLILIDGIKVENPQTGHHTMNMALPLDVIERIEIVKGAAARIFGQKAYTGAINIVTKTNADNVNSINLQGGSFKQKNGAVTIGTNIKNSSVIAHASANLSDGYRFNTDYKNYNYFIKATFNRNKTPINVLGYFTERKFGANGFYASPEYINQYEETQSSLFGITSVYKFKNLTIKPKLYWKRGQDMYLFVRNKPSGYKNLHITNKIGGEVNMSYNSKLGITGFGFDIAKVSLSSRTKFGLGGINNFNRIVTNVFLEHRFTLLDGNLDITPGASVNHFSDIGSFFFPGIDLGYQINDKFMVYANAGYTHRIPTYTNLYYKSRTSVGNANLKPEKALSEEVGVKYNNNGFSAFIVAFHRDSKEEIDYVKNIEANPWEPKNFMRLKTYGIELNSSLNFEVAGYNQNINLGYTYINDYSRDNSYKFSRYSINSIKHHFTTTVSTQFLKGLKQSIVYKLAQRADGDTYNVVDAKISYSFNNVELSLMGNNLFNEIYSETNLVPMPKSNFMAGLKFNF
ncbi:MAG: TonB-dependent receptor [Tenacibaculum sp.]|nr:TonB-dependent receptor [Tenacibaculum sp.]